MSQHSLYTISFFFHGKDLDTPPLRQIKTLLHQIAQRHGRKIYDLNYFFSQ